MTRGVLPHLRSATKVGWPYKKLLGSTKRPPLFAGKNHGEVFVLKWTSILVSIALLYVAVAYLLLPALWRHHEHQTGLASKPMVTHTGEGIPGDPLNVGLVGDMHEIAAAMKLAGWSPADPITIRSGVDVAASVILDRSYPTAPVSNLYYEGRKEDLAFEKQIGASPARRHHVRFWKVLEKGIEGRNVWLGSATLDRDVGFSKYTGQITHHIDGDIDAEREQVINDLTTAGKLETIYSVSGVGPTLNGRNGGGDRYFTDGEILIGVISGETTALRRPVVLEQPLAVTLKNQLWKAIRSFQ